MITLRGSSVGSVVLILGLGWSRPHLWPRSRSAQRSNHYGQQLDSRTCGTVTDPVPAEMCAATHY
jgi:hypothetical protein